LLALHPTWDVVPAIQNNRVYSLNPELLLRPGPRLIQGARQMAQALHPDRFAAAPPESVAIP
jgi:iron complex transport system substrate-binding protein